MYGDFKLRETIAVIGRRQLMSGSLTNDTADLGISPEFGTNGDAFLRQRSMGRVQMERNVALLKG